MKLQIEIFKTHVQVEKVFAAAEEISLDQPKVAHDIDIGLWQRSVAVFHFCSGKLNFGFRLVFDRPELFWKFKKNGFRLTANEFMKILENLSDLHNTRD